MGSGAPLGLTRSLASQVEAFLGYYSQQEETVSHAHFTMFSPFEVYSDEKSQEIFEKKARVSHLSKYFLSEIGKN